MKRIFTSIWLLAFATMSVLGSCSGKRGEAADSVPDESPAASVAALPGELRGKERKAVIDSLAVDWHPWRSVAVNGKVKAPGLPLTPTARIFMEYGTSILISLRAPLLGEVGRLEINDSTAVAVNKMNKTYVEEPISGLLTRYPGAITDFQELLLGRIVFPGAGLLSQETGDATGIFLQDDGTLLLLPSGGLPAVPAEYGYCVDAEEGLVTFAVASPEKPDEYFSLEYTFFERGYDITATVRSEKLHFAATLELDQPQWDVSGFAPLGQLTKYRRVTLEEFWKAI